MRFFRVKYIVSIFVVIVSLLIAWILFTVSSYNVCEAENFQTLPKREYALVLGTGKYLKNGGMNLYYLGRIEAAVQLYKAGVVKKLILSGDNSKADYNEPEMMREDVCQRGVSANDVVLDFAGFRTLDSIRRCKNLFKCCDPIIVSQKYHAKRALYLCESNNMKNALAYEAKADVFFRYLLRNNLREFMAWVKAWVDVNITNKKAKFEN